MQKVLVFGAFDNIHEGHRYMLKKAKSLGDYLIVTVAKDVVIKDLKGKSPSHKCSERIQSIKNERIVDEVITGDNTHHSWQVIKKYKPQIIALGYDQIDLKKALEEYLEKTFPETEDWAINQKKPKIVILEAFKPETYHSSILNNKI